MAAEDYLTLETGAGVNNANTWIDVTWADQYHLERNRTAWAALSDEAKVAAILLACQWMVATYTFRGSQTDRARLPFPASAAYDGSDRLIDGVPPEAQRAQAELAFDHAVNDNALDEVFDRSLDSLQVGPVSLNWSEWEPQEVTRTLVERELSGLITGGGAHNASVEISAGFYPT